MEQGLLLRVKEVSKLSAVVTCFNNQETIAKCIESLKIADEIIVLDSFSSDKTLSILKQYNCTIHQQEFLSYSQQKQNAINLANNDWVILLDSDEYLTINAQEQLAKWKKSPPQADAYDLPRQEWVFWQWSHAWVRMNRFVRLFDKTKAAISDDLVHESVKTTGSSASINAIIKHFGETSISKKVEKINAYSQLSAQQKHLQGKTVSPIKLLFYPGAYFIKQYFFRRQIFNGWAGLINAYLNSRYAFLKYAKLYELQRKKSD